MTTISEKRGIEGGIVGGLLGAAFTCYFTRGMDSGLLGEVIVKKTTECGLAFGRGDGKKYLWEHFQAIWDSKAAQQAKHLSQLNHNVKDVTVTMEHQATFVKNISSQLVADSKQHQESSIAATNAIKQTVNQIDATANKLVDLEKSISQKTEDFELINSNLEKLNQTLSQINEEKETKIRQLTQRTQSLESQLREVMEKSRLKISTLRKENKALQEEKEMLKKRLYQFAQKV